MFNYLKKWFLSIGGLEIVRGLNSKRIRILMYHRFCDSPSAFKLEQEVFNQQIAFLKSSYNVMSLDLLCSSIREGIPLPKNVVSLTIDDGYADCYYYAFPVLKKHGIIATVFLTTDFVDKNSWLWPDKIEYILTHSIIKQFSVKMNDLKMDFDVSTFKGWHKAQVAIFDHCRRMSDQSKNEFIEMLSRKLGVEVPGEVTEEFTPLTWKQIKEMSTYGISFSSHTQSHAILSRLNRAAAENEISGSKRIIEEKLSREVAAFCYPNGEMDDFSEETISIIRSCGYQCAATTIEGMNNIGGDLFRLKRIGIGNSSMPYFMKRLAFGH